MTTCVRPVRMAHLRIQILATQGRDRHDRSTKHGLGQGSGRGQIISRALKDGGIVRPEVAVSLQPGGEHPGPRPTACPAAPARRRPRNHLPAAGLVWSRRQAPAALERPVGTCRYAAAVVAARRLGSQEVGAAMQHRGCGQVLEVSVPVDDGTAGAHNRSQSRSRPPAVPPEQRQSQAVAVLREG